jgi:hypothetical protein
MRAGENCDGPSPFSPPSSATLPPPSSATPPFLRNSAMEVRMDLSDDAPLLSGKVKYIQIRYSFLLKVYKHPCWLKDSTKEIQINQNIRTVIVIGSVYCNCTIMLNILFDIL